MKVLVSAMLVILNLFSANITFCNNLFKSKSYKQAYICFSKIKNNIEANNNLAMMEYYGLGVPYNQADAVMKLEKLIKDHPKEGIVFYNLAMMYFNGYYDNIKRKVIIDRKKAKILLHKACQLGYKPAKLLYKKLYLHNKENNATKKK